ncbi:putative amidophosphoribosyltransferase [Streptomyces sp. Amel2xB2]|uniref:ComF family protein n=1 Tax=Streptomyces sp. Amel2xB2 TaxID=1305829 RepID=UPI000DC04716|nr:ComF family protein [Streptomyces sp. Amel2xB2]RAJ69615.1 putative amidophosphoribosyltransferase [Streptomyces sp. Amel2xB2]
MRASWRGLREELAGLVLPSGCAGCGLPRVRGELCARCAGALAGAAPHRVRPSPVPYGLPRVYAALPYDGQVRRVLLAHKERGALRLAVPLGELLASVIREVLARTAGERRAGPGAVPARRRRSSGPEPGDGVLTLVPVPSARRAVAVRGHDPVRRIALAAARELREGGLRARVLTVLRQRRTVADQAGLTARERAANLSGALELVPGGGRPLAEGRTLLVDDVMTTGASLAEAARAVAERIPRSTAVYAAAVVAFSPRARAHV